MKISGKERLWNWFGLSHASFLVLPRVLMQEMPDEWQDKMTTLLDEFNNAFTNLEPNECQFAVRSVNLNGRLVKLPEWLKNYRHPDQERIKEVK